MLYFIYKHFCCNVNLEKEVLKLKILSDEIVSSTDIIKNFTDCRKKTKKMGKTFIFKNNTPDLVLMDINEYENTYQRIVDFIEDAEHIAIYNMIEERRKNDTGKRYSITELIEETQKNKQ